MSRDEYPVSSAARRTAATQSASKRSSGWSQIRCMATPRSQRLADRRQRRAKIRLHRIERATIGMPQVDHEEHLARHDIGRVRPVLDPSDGGDTRRMLPADGIHRLDQPRGAEQCVLAQMHRRRAGVRVLPGHRHLIPAHRLHAGDHADVLAFGLQDRTLLDVQFEERRQRMLAAALRAAITDGVQRRGEGHAIAVLPGLRPVLLQHLRKHPGRHHRRRKARALFVGPVHHLDRRIGFVARFNQGAQRLQRRERAEHAVELSAGRLGVEMAAERDRRHVRRAVAAREHRAHVVDGDVAAELFRPRLEPVAHLTIQIGEREPADAALRACRRWRRSP